MKLNLLCWLQIVNKVRYDCSIRVSVCSIRVYRSFIGLRSLVIVFQPNNVSYIKLSSFFQLIKPFNSINYSYKPPIILKIFLLFQNYSCKIGHLLFLQLCRHNRRRPIQSAHTNCSICAHIKQVDVYIQHYLKPAAIHFYLN